ncbi:carnitine acetyl transferase [Suillus occidentalis]|nr:carnitine acetyl transferase [Suillus occidentalis]
MERIQANPRSPLAVLLQQSLFPPNYSTPGCTFANQHTLPSSKFHLLTFEDACKRYLIALRGLRDDEEHAVQALSDGEGPALTERLNACVEDFWFESSLSCNDPVALALNPFFVLDFIHDLCQGLLDPDAVRDRALDCGCKILANDAAHWFDALEEDHRPLLIEREVLRNLQAICMDADKPPISEVACMAIGALTTENRKTWSSLRHELAKDKTNAACLRLVGTCTNWWYDKHLIQFVFRFMLQIIVCADGADGGHTVLRYIPAASNAFSFIRSHYHQVLTSSIKHSAPTLYHAFLSPHAKSFTPPKSTAIGVWPVFSQSFSCDASFSKLLWTLTPSIRGGVRYAEMQLSDLICQNDCWALEFKAIRTVQPESVDFTKTSFSECLPHDEIRRLHKASERRVRLTKECSQGFGQDRCRYALYCLHQCLHALPSIFGDLGWNLLSTTILSTSNCGNPALHLFGFGPVAADGYSTGCIIKEGRDYQPAGGGRSVASSKHLQTRRFLDTLPGYLSELHHSANEHPAPFVDHAGILRDSKTGRPINGRGYGPDESGSDYEDAAPGYSFFDSSDIDLLGRRKGSSHANIVGKVLPLSDH